jgi:hypothetical protein
MTRHINKGKYACDVQVNASSQTLSKQDIPTEVNQKNWRSFVGRLSESPNFNGDSVEIQRKMCDEW